MTFDPRLTDFFLQEQHVLEIIRHNNNYPRGKKMAKATKKSKKSLSEQLEELSTPKPVSYHPDQEDQADLTAAKVVEFAYEAEEQEPRRHKRRKLLLQGEEFDNDPKYSGRTVTRSDLQDNSEGNSTLWLYHSHSFQF